MRATLIRLSVLAAAVLAAGAPAAHAQLLAGPGASLKPQSAKPRAAPPAALPGAAVDKDMVTPSDRPIGDMQPTEALFDAIDRGDIASARDAISRGADVDGRNALGMTPLDLSIDLGRKDISFLLLSLRGTGSGNAAVRPPSSAQADAADKRKASAAEKRAAAEARRQAKLTSAVAARDPSPGVPRAPKQFAGDGGAPVPSAGFLGFDEGRASSLR
jgi:hypothetical protein